MKAAHFQVFDDLVDGQAERQNDIQEYSNRKKVPVLTLEEN